MAIYAPTFEQYSRETRENSNCFLFTMGLLLQPAGITYFQFPVRLTRSRPMSQRLSIIKIRVQKPKNSLHVNWTEESQWRREKTPKL